MDLYDYDIIHCSIVIIKIESDASMSQYSPSIAKLNNHVATDLYKLIQVFNQSKVEIRIVHDLLDNPKWYCDSSLDQSSTCFKVIP